MKLNLVKTTSAHLDSGARCILALEKQPFFFLWYRGQILMNREVKGARKLTKAVETMWKYEYMENDKIMAEFDAAYNVISRTAGKTAADQALDAWRADAKRSRKTRAKAAALEWIAADLDQLNDDTWDLLHSLGYNGDFINTGLFDAYCELRDRHPDSPYFKEYFKRWANAAFAYGFRFGQQIGAATGYAVKDDGTNMLQG